jgi:hypothetical protein
MRAAVEDARRWTSRDPSSPESPNNVKEIYDGQAQRISEPF